MAEWEELIRQLSDDPEECEREGGLICFERHGDSRELRVQHVSGVGPAVEVEGGTFKDVRSYIQSNVLQLPRLAAQVVRTLEKRARQRPAPFVDGPAEVASVQRKVAVAAALPKLKELLLTVEDGTTRVVQLMAPAGQGKTVLLESLAAELGKDYMPDAHPTPILLPVDLLGRYVGTIDDAIAGSLNNTYSAPGLSQRDVATAMRERWLVLALDGFDELVARVGVRDGFLRVSELLEQLNGSGTVVLSARESFFELHEITSGIRAYLQPRRGSYDTLTMKLSQWTMAEGHELFRQLGAGDPVAAFGGLHGAFEHDDEIVLHPFFLARLASQWLKGERFMDAKRMTDRQHRTRYVIEAFLKREATEKWTDRVKVTPLLSLEQHERMLGSIAEEMWRSAAFELRTDELVLAAELGLDSDDLPDGLLRDVKERLPTHGLVPRSGGTHRFLHDRFLHYFLSIRLANRLASRDLDSIRAIMSPRDLGPAITGWVAWSLRQASDVGILIAETLNELCLEKGVSNEMLANCGGVAAELMSGDRVSSTTVKRMAFAGEALRGRAYEGILFEDCKFWTTDLSRTTFENCTFVECAFTNTRIDRTTRFQETEFRQTTFDGVTSGEDHTVFSPSAIRALLRTHGATLAEPSNISDQKDAIDSNVVRSLERMIRQTERACDLVLEELSGIQVELARIGLSQKMLKNVTRPSSGRKKRFVRFDVDRARILRGQSERTGVPEIDGFWSKVRQRYPSSG